MPDRERGAADLGAIDRRRLTVRPAAPLAFALTLVGGAARADDARPAALSWVRLPGAEACADGPTLARAVNARLGRSALVPLADAEVVVEGRIEPQNGGFRATIGVHDGARQGSRTIERTTARCADLDADLALVVAVTIDPNAALGTPPSPPTPTPTLVLQREVVPVRVEVPVPVAPPPPREPWRMDVEGAPTLVFGLLPGVAVGALGRVSVRPKIPVRVEASASVLPEKNAQAPQNSASARIGAAFGSLAICPELARFGGTGLVACARGSLGTHHASGFGVDHSKDDERTYSEVGVAGRARTHLFGPFHFLASVGAGAPLSREVYRFTDGTGASHVIFSSSPVVVTLEVGLGVGFGS